LNKKDRLATIDSETHWHFAPLILLVSGAM